MLPVQPGCLHRTQKELRPVRVLPRVRHGERSGCPMPERKVFVLEPIAVDRFATRAVVPGEVASLWDVGGRAIWVDGSCGVRGGMMGRGISSINLVGLVAACVSSLLLLLSLSLTWHMKFGMTLCRLLPLKCITLPDLKDVADDTTQGGDDG